MTYENTHLWAADAVKAQIIIDALNELINNNIDYYYFGAVFPDTFSYSQDKKISDISEQVVLDCLKKPLPETTLTQARSAKPRRMLGFQ